MKSKIVPLVLVVIQLIIVLIMLFAVERRGADPKWQEEEPTGIIGLEASYFSLGGK